MIKPLSKKDCQRLAHHLPDGPQTVISRAHLRWGTARAYAVGLTDVGFETAVIEDPGCPGEPMIFGSNAEQIAELLPQIPNWFCVNVATNLADALEPLLAERLGCTLRRATDVYHTLTQPPPANSLAHPNVRLLTRDDLPLLMAAPPELRGHDPAHLLHRTAVAGAIFHNQLVAIAQNYALTEGFGDIGVFTLPDFRGRGLAAAAAALVADWLLRNGRTPVWSCGAHNQPSLRVAKKLGFIENGRRVYLIRNQ
ncbi:MAG: GNAT family N-acetyltransferase [Ardenticatenaceae bacterium]|nr:GNAT family N-acetyltransferase [Anaerolineales bacterium]MCB8939739.1 GNAT family N-acetyltransferase [Ardenticatenaceae bacterium]MCB8975177.1 GNAT family N-acetyltransferase [Ardenticatenaceae bacterium]